MEISSEEKSKLQELEESLWLPETRFDYEYMDSILAPDFFEFGRSGKVYRREDTLAAPKQEINAKLPLKDLKIRAISDDVVQVTYMSEVQDEGLEVGNRSSIWAKTSDGWKLKFHQGTVVQ